MPRIKSYLRDSHPDLLKEWDERLNGHNFNDLATTSHVLAHWICPLGHSYEAIVANRTAKGQGCSYCAGKKVLAGFNDFESAYPELMREWDWDANTSLPSEIHRGSHQKVHWRCHLGHRWSAAIANRVSKANLNGCPYCSGNRLLVGFNDIFTLYPLLSSKWAADLNGVDPLTLRLGHSQPVSWRCTSCGATWKRKIDTEARRNTTECSACLRGRSGLENAVLDYIQETFPHLKIELNERTILPTYELDFYFPELKKALEINGEYWHSDERLRLNGHESAKAYHDSKLSEAKAAGVSLGFIWEDDWAHRPEEVKSALHRWLAGESVQLLERVDSRRQHPLLKEQQTALKAEIESWARKLNLSSRRQSSLLGTAILVDERLAILPIPQAFKVEELAQLQTAYEDEGMVLFYVYPWDHLPALLAHWEAKLSLPRRKFAAKRLSLREVPTAEADAFVAAHHYQGRASGRDKISLGLYGGEELLAVQQYSRYRFSTKAIDDATAWEGLRLCFKPGVQIYGAATRLQRYFERVYRPDSIVSYVDPAHSTGDFKSHQGFRAIQGGSESFRWVLQGEPNDVTILDKNGVERKADLAAVAAMPYLNPNRVKGAFGRGVGALFFGGKLGSKKELEAQAANGALTHNDAILEALGYRRYITLPQMKWLWEPVDAETSV